MEERGWRFFPSLLSCSQSIDLQSADSANCLLWLTASSPPTHLPTPKCPEIPTPLAQGWELRSCVSSPLSVRFGVGFSRIFLGFFFFGGNSVTLPPSDH